MSRQGEGGGLGPPGLRWCRRGTEREEHRDVSRDAEWRTGIEAFPQPCHSRFGLGTSTIRPLCGPRLVAAMRCLLHRPHAPHGLPAADSFPNTCRCSADAVTDEPHTSAGSCGLLRAAAHWAHSVRKLPATLIPEWRTAGLLLGGAMGLINALGNLGGLQLPPGCLTFRHRRIVTLDLCCHGVVRSTEQELWIARTWEVRMRRLLLTTLALVSTAFAGEPVKDVFYLASFFHSIPKFDEGYVFEIPKWDDVLIFGRDGGSGFGEPTLTWTSVVVALVPAAFEHSDAAADTHGGFRCPSCIQRGGRAPGRDCVSGSILQTDPHGGNRSLCSCSCVLRAQRGAMGAWRGTHA